MPEDVRTRVEALLRRAGLHGVPPGPAVAAVVFCVLAVAFGLWRWGSSPAAPAFSVEESAGASGAGSEVATRPQTPTASTDSPTATVVVHVAGCVRHPGVYTLPANGRVIDAIEAAGGTLPDAAPDALNLARGLSDGEQILVPSEDDAGQAPAAAAGSGAGGATTQGGAASQTTGAKVNINTADATALDSLPGVGPSTAEKIIADREANGPFSAVEDLGRVSGIGPKKLEQLSGLVCVN